MYYLPRLPSPLADVNGFLNLRPYRPPATDPNHLLLCLDLLASSSLDRSLINHLLINRPEPYCQGFLSVKVGTLNVLKHSAKVIKPHQYHTKKIKRNVTEDHGVFDTFDE